MEKYRCRVFCRLSCQNPGLWTGAFDAPGESNPHYRFRRPALYPLSYRRGDKWTGERVYM